MPEHAEAAGGAGAEAGAAGSKAGKASRKERLRAKKAAKRAERAAASDDEDLGASAAPGPQARKHIAAATASLSSQNKAQSCMGSSFVSRTSKLSQQWLGLFSPGCSSHDVF